MDTLLYAGQTVVGIALLVVGLRWSATRRAGLGMTSTSVTTYDDEEVARGNGLLGVVISAATIALGAAGLVGLSVPPAPVGIMITGFGLISVLLAADTAPAGRGSEMDAVALVPAPRTSSEIIAMPTRSGAGPVPGSARRAA